MPKTSALPAAQVNPPEIKKATLKLVETGAAKPIEQKQADKPTFIDDVEDLWDNMPV